MEYKTRINVNDIVGKQFHRLLVVSYDHKERYKHKFSYFYKCECQCENKTKLIVNRMYLLNNGIKSCGCLHSEQSRINVVQAAKASITHNMSNTRFYSIWAGLKDRCKNINSPEYSNYGGRGITYDPRWDDFNNFYNDMYESYIQHVEEYGEKDTTIDRIDVNGNYCKYNCRWATIKEQNKNKRTTNYIYYDGKYQTINDIFTNYHHNSTITESILKDRILKLNWNVNDALNTSKKTCNLYNIDYRQNLRKPIHFFGDPK